MQAEKKNVVNVSANQATFTFGISAVVLSAVVVAVLIDDPVAAFIAVVLAGASGALLARYMVPLYAFGNLGSAMACGALVAFLSHIPFVIMFMSVMTIVERSWMGLDDFFYGIMMFLTAGWLFVGVPQLVIGAVAGWACYYYARESDAISADPEA